MKPILVERFFLPDGFRMRGISLQFERDGENAPWTKAQTTVRPRNFPKGEMHASSLIHFFDFVLRRVVQEIRRDERIGNPIVFYFAHRKLPGLFLQVESRDDLVDIKDTYPSSFHLVKMVRRGEKLIEEVVSIP